MGDIRGFRDLQTYRAAWNAAMRVFEVSRTFPAEEKYSLTAQIRRASRSVAANVIEAWRRRRYPAAFVAKLVDAEAEATETQVFLDFALGCGYIDEATHRALDEEYNRLIGRIVRMAQHPEKWSRGGPAGPVEKDRHGPGGASRRRAGGVRPRPKAPAPADTSGREEELRKPDAAAKPPQLGRKRSRTPPTPGQEARP